jgi:PAS domain S-box-containing protein
LTEIQEDHPRPAVTVSPEAAPPDPALDALAALAAELTGARAAWIVLDGEAGPRVVAAAGGPPPSAAALSVPLPAAEGRARGSLRVAGPLDGAGEGALRGVARAAAAVLEDRHRAEDRLRTVLAQAPAAVYETDREGRRAWTRDPLGILSPGFDGLGAIEGRVLGSGAGETARLSVEGEAGAASVAVAAEPMRDAAGGVSGVRVAALDVTEEERVERAWLRGKEQLDLAMRAGKLGVWDSDFRTGLIEATPTCKANLGLPADFPLTRQALLDAMHPDDRAAVGQAIGRAIERGGDYEVEYRVVWPDGGTHWILSRGTVLLEGGRPRRMVGVTFDITALRSAEAEARRQLELTRLIAHFSAEATFLMDEAGRVTFANPAAERMFGWPAAELEGRVLHDVVHHHRSDGRPFPMSECPLVSVFATRRTLVAHEDVFFRRDGSTVEVACSNAPVEVDGRLTGAVLVAHDISERKRAEERQRILVNELDHRVKNMLATVQSIARLSLREGGAAADLRDSLVGRLSALGQAHDLLRLGGWESVGLGDLLRTVLRPYEGAGPGGGGRAAIDGPEDVRVGTNLAVPLGMALHELGQVRGALRALGAGRGALARAGRGRGPAAPAGVARRGRPAGRAAAAPGLRLDAAGAAAGPGGRRQRQPGIPARGRALRRGDPAAVSPLP